MMRAEEGGLRKEEEEEKNPFLQPQNLHYTNVANVGF